MYHNWEKVFSLQLSFYLSKRVSLCSRYGFFYYSQGFQNRTKKGDPPHWRELEILLGKLFLSDGWNLRSSDFEHFNLFKS